MASTTESVSEGGSRATDATARFNTGYDRHVRDRYASRTVADSGMYLLPYLESLDNNKTTAAADSRESTPVFTYLDVGCGPGSITIDFAQRFPRAFIVGVDPAESFIRAATSRAAELGVRNVLFLTGDVFQLEEAILRGLDHGDGASVLASKLGIPGGDGATTTSPRSAKGTFDVVSCHQVLSHLQPSRRPAALRNMHDLARKGGVGGGGGGGGGGGIVAAREAELEGLMSIHPETPLLSQWRALFYGVLRATHLTNEDDDGGASSSSAGSITGTAAAEQKYPGLGSTFAGKYLLETALGTGLWAREQIKVTGSLNSHSQQEEKDAWVASIAPMLDDKDTAWNKRAVKYLTSSYAPTAGSDGVYGGGTSSRDSGRRMTEDEALRLMRDIADAWRAWARDDAAWLGIGSCEIVCRG